VGRSSCAGQKPVQSVSAEETAQILKRRAERGDHRGLRQVTGMPILDAYKARTVMIIKRGMTAGFAGIDNELDYAPNTLMLFGDAKSFAASLVKEVAGAH
jgi:hypothetical protein